MRNSTRLPATHLRGDTLTAFEAMLRDGCTDPSLEIELDHGPVTYRYSSTDEIVSNVTLPALVRSFKVVLTAREGRIELTTDGSQAPLRLRLDGNPEWVVSRTHAIESFFETHGSTVRTLLERYLAIGMAATAVALGLVLYAAGFGPVIGMRVPGDALLYGALAVILGGLLHLALHRIYPYALVVTGNGDHRLLVYLAT